MPGTLLHRDVVLRVVAAVCRLVRTNPDIEQEAGRRRLADDFDDKVVSAVGEAFSNVVVHAYSGARRGDVELTLEFDHDSLRIRMFDTGKSFDLAAEPAPALDTLPESHLGLLIIRACMDEVSYQAGLAPSPNILTLTKRYLARD